MLNISEELEQKYRRYHLVSEKDSKPKLKKKDFPSYMYQALDLNYVVAHALNCAHSSFK